MKLTPNDIRSFVNESYFKRGREYFEEGLVHFVSIESDKVKARALGTKMYEITLFYKKKIIWRLHLPSLFGIWTV